MPPSVPPKYPFKNCLDYRWGLLNCNTIHVLHKGTFQTSLTFVSTLLITTLPFSIRLSLTELLTSNGGLLELIELALDKAQDQAGLSHCHVPQQHQFKLADLGLGQVAVSPGVCTGGHGEGGVVGMWGVMGVLLGSLSKHNYPKLWTSITSDVFLQPLVLKPKESERERLLSISARDERLVMLYLL